MKTNVCKTCGGQLERSGNYLICESCGNKWAVDDINDSKTVRLANAWESLRNADFDKASGQFDEIISDDLKCHEAYWGRALALNGIVFVTDLNENKKVPTCNSITENSFIASPDVKKAISLAPGEIAKTYTHQAEEIDRIRVEWLEKARKEPPYDVFICYKESDREKGIARTQDSIDAQELYTVLTEKGYKVFFSRNSLRDKTSERYEPYIYNAIKTAHIMIVFGEKSEYFSAVWLKNEWHRFKGLIERGEKHKNSLVTVYKDIDPTDLPLVLKTGSV